MTINEHTDLEIAIDTLLRGGIILYPTDTVWGLGCDARNDKAVNRIFELKRRPDSKAMLLLCSNLEMAEQYVDKIPENVRIWLDKVKRPTTVIYPGAHGVSSRLIASDESIGIRIPNNDFCQKLCRRLGGPIVSTSANFAGIPSNGQFSDISLEIKKSVDYICHTGRNQPTGHPSDIVKIGSDGSLIEIRIFENIKK